MPEQPKKYMQVELEMMVDQMREMLPAQLQVQTINAQILFRKYTELQNAGFTKEEALKIVVSRPVNDQ